MAKTGSKFATRFWKVVCKKEDNTEYYRLVQGPKHYRVSKVKKDLLVTCPELNVQSVKRIPRPSWSIIFKEIKENV
jgi:hypothetical protein